MVTYFLFSSLISCISLVFGVKQPTKKRKVEASGKKEAHGDEIDDGDDGNDIDNDEGNDDNDDNDDEDDDDDTPAEAATKKRDKIHIASLHRTHTHGSASVSVDRQDCSLAWLRRLMGYKDREFTEQR